MKKSVSWQVQSSGFTLMELLIVVAILALVIVGSMMSYVGQMRKGFDGRRKTDLAKLAAAFENYFNDRNTYPPDSSLLSPCGGNQMESWGIPRMLCDPESKTPYYYEYVDPPGGFRLYTILKNTTDSDIDRLGCNPSCIAGLPYNYGVSSGVPVSQNQ